MARKDPCAQPQLVHTMHYASGKTKDQRSPEPASQKRQSQQAACQLTVQLGHIVYFRAKKSNDTCRGVCFGNRVYILLPAGTQDRSVQTLPVACAEETRIRTKVLGWLLVAFSVRHRLLVLPARDISCSRTAAATAVTAVPLLVRVDGRRHSCSAKIRWMPNPQACASWINGGCIAPYKHG